MCKIFSTSVLAEPNTGNKYNKYNKVHTLLLGNMFSHLALHSEIEYHIKYIKQHVHCNPLAKNYFKKYNILYFRLSAEQRQRSQSSRRYQVKTILYLHIFEIQNGISCCYQVRILPSSMYSTVTSVYPKLNAVYVCNGTTGHKRNGRSQCRNKS